MIKRPLDEIEIRVPTCSPRLVMTEDMKVCDYCKTPMSREKLNIEAKLHHGADDIRCVDRRSCERRKRKLDKKARKNNEI